MPNCVAQISLLHRWLQFAPYHSEEHTHRPSPAAPSRHDPCPLQTRFTPTAASVVDGHATLHVGPAWFGAQSQLNPRVMPNCALHRERQSPAPNPASHSSHEAPWKKPSATDEWHAHDPSSELQVP